MKKINTTLLTGISSMVITIILYSVILNDVFFEIIHLITLLGVLLSEATVTFIANYAKDNPRKIAATTVSFFMIPISVILSFVYIVNFPEGYFTYIAWYLAFYIATGVLAIILLQFNEQKEFENTVLQNAKSNMLNMRNIVKCIMVDPNATEYKKELNEIEEKLHFSNDSVVSPQDATICDMLNELQNNIGNDEFDKIALINNIKVAIDKRTIMTKNM